VRVIQPSVGFIALSANITINFARFTDCWKKLSSLCVSQIGKGKINI